LLVSGTVTTPSTVNAAFYSQRPPRAAQILEMTAD
jgi:hypothetical protein